ncbi:hypothetical protein ACFV3E_24440 [Streptomyces sp. NPDC059718]
MQDPAPPAEKDAEEVRPWDKDRDPPIRTKAYTGAGRPRMRVRTGGQWRDARVRARHDWPDGVRLLCDVYLPDGDGSWAWYVRYFRWDPTAMRTR